MAAPAPRRGPGRPPRKPPAPPLEKHGVVDSPHDPGNVLEFVHESPSALKHLFAYFKGANARQIHVFCDPLGLTFFARDHHRHQRIVVRAAGAHSNWFFCAGRRRVGLSRETLDPFFATIDKSFTKITLLISDHEPDQVTFVLYDADRAREVSYDFALAHLEPDEELFETEALLSPEALARGFPLSFAFSEKGFKKSVTDAGAYGNSLTISKRGAEPLVLSHQKPFVAYREVYREPEKISLVSSLPPGCVFRCSFSLDDVRPLAASMVSGEVRIFCGEGGPVLFRSASDEGLLLVSVLVGPPAEAGGAGAG